MGFLILEFGGLTVLSEIDKVLPNESWIYLGDTLNFPYGPKTKEDVIEFSKNNAEWLISKGVKAIIIACGTATSHALLSLQNEYDIEITRNN